MTRSIGRAWRALLAVATAGLIAGCAPWSPGPDPEGTARASGVPVYWVGESFEGLGLSSADGWEQGAGVTYGTCAPPSGDGGCAPPLQIQTVRTCPAGAPVRRLAGERVVRGVPAGRRGGGLVLLTGDLEVRISGAADRASRAALALRTVDPSARGVVRAGGQLPPPVPDAGRRVGCRR